MAYITGTVTDANPGPALYALIAPALTSAGFTLVDTVTISTRTHKVWKSAAANNTANLDWYLDVMYTTAGAGQLFLIPFEFFDPATDLGYRGAYSNYNPGMDLTTFSRFGATGYALETNWNGPTNQPAAGGGMTLATSAFGYWISVTGNRVLAMLSNDATSVSYAGMYTPDPLYAAKAGAALYPLMAGKIYAGGTPHTTPIASSESSTNWAAFTRIPPVTSNTWYYSIQLHSLWKQTRLPQIPTVSGAYPFVVNPIVIYTNDNNATPADYAMFGAPIDLAVVPAGAAVSRGDTVTISGASWVLTTQSASTAIAFKAV